MKEKLIKIRVRFALTRVCRTLAFYCFIVMICCNISFNTINIQNMEQKGITFSGKLNVLDSALDRFANKHQTQVKSPNIEYYPPVNVVVENRHINWKDGSIEKAIVIVPHQTPQEVKSDAWDFIVLAWVPDAPSREKPFRESYLLKNADIDTLKSKIEDLLSQAEQQLKDIKLEDLK